MQVFGAILTTSSATRFVGDGSLLINLPAAAWDRITSGTANVVANNNTGISVSAPLEVSGTVKLAGTGAEACTLATVGMVRMDPVTGAIQVCRP